MASLRIITGKQALVKGLLAGDKCNQNKCQGKSGKKIFCYKLIAHEKHCKHQELRENKGLNGFVWKDTGNKGIVAERGRIKY